MQTRVRANLHAGGAKRESSNDDGDRGDQQLLRATRTADGPKLERLGDVRFVPLLSGVPNADEAAVEALDAEPDAARLA